MIDTIFQSLSKFDPGFHSWFCLLCHVPPLTSHITLSNLLALSQILSISHLEYCTFLLTASFQQLQDKNTTLLMWLTGALRYSPPTSLISLSLSLCSGNQIKVLTHARALPLNYIPSPLIFLKPPSNHFPNYRRAVVFKRNALCCIYLYLDRWV